MAYNPITIPITVAADSEALSVSAAVAVVAGNAVLGTKSITSNGIYNAASDGYDGYSSVDVSVSGGSSTLITKNISANGTYNASSDSADGYSQVTVAVPASAVDSGTKNISTNGTHDVVGYANANVNVPNSYSAGDEGKVVSNGALVAQTSDTVTQNDTYDTTLINSLTVNVSGGGSSMYSGDFTPTERVGKMDFYAPNCTYLAIASFEAPDLSTGMGFINMIFGKVDASLTNGCLVMTAQSNNSGSNQSISSGLASALSGKPYYVYSNGTFTVNLSGNDAGTVSNSTKTWQAGRKYLWWAW